MTYRLHYAMLLPVGNMIDAGGADMSAEKLAQALEAMAQEVRDNPESLNRILGSPVSSEIEDRWVMRSTSEAHVVLTPSGIVSTKSIKDPSHFTSEQILSLDLNTGRDMLWCRPEDTGGLPVLMKITDESGKFLGQLDLRDWMAWADPEDILHHLENDWDFSPAIWDAGDDEYERNGQVNPLCSDANLLLALKGRENHELHGTIHANDRMRASRYVEELHPGLIARIAADPPRPRLTQGAGAASGWVAASKEGYRSRMMIFSGSKIAK